MKKVIFKHFDYLKEIKVDGISPGITNEMRFLFDGITVREIILIDSLSKKDKNYLTYDCSISENDFQHWYWLEHPNGEYGWLKERYGWMILDLWFDEVDEFKDIAELFEL